MTQEQQEEIKSILSKNRFEARRRPGRGPAILQGLLRCAVCNNALAVTYDRLDSWTYMCGWNTEPCTRFTSCEFETNVLARVFKMLESPPLEMLQAALEETRRQNGRGLTGLNLSANGLSIELRKAQELVDRSYGKHQRVYDHAVEKFEAILVEKENFERKVAIQQAKSQDMETDEELNELCRLASDVPAFWHDPGVSNQDRKEILRCLIDQILVRATKERIDATIVWKTGSQTSLAIWRGFGRYILIRELHGQNLTTLQIKQHLAAGKTSTGQIVNIGLSQILVMLRKMNLKPIRTPANYFSLRQIAAELSQEGRTAVWIAKHFTEQGFPSASHKPWNRAMVDWLLERSGTKPESLEDLHRSAFNEARARGLNYRTNGS